MNLDFSSDIFKNKALSTDSINYENDITSADAFFLVLKGLDYQTMDNLCETVKSKLKFKDSKKIYDFIQSDGCNQEFKQIVLDTAYELIHDNIELGSKFINEKFSASSWISHSLYEGEVAYNLANIIGLNGDCAKKIGILHDIGRKFDHSFKHVIKGYEYLILLGLNDEAICSLTHSFLPTYINNNLKGNRCANCDPSIKGFYIDKNGNGVFKDESNKDDITLFLDNYKYNEYDTILNISDLMAMSSGIVSPYDRIQDIYTRKIPDPINSPFFKLCFINLLRRILYRITNDNMYLDLYNINEIDNIDELLIEISNEFMNMYNELIINNKSTIRI